MIPDQPSIILLEHTARQDKQILDTLNSTFKVIPYSAKLLREKNFHKLAENTIFVEKTFVNCSLVLPMDTTPLNFTKKTFANSHKTSKSAKVFSLKSFPLYDTFKSYMYIEAMIPDEFTQEPYMTSRSYNCIHVQYIKPTNKGLYN